MPYFRHEGQRLARADVVLEPLAAAHEAGLFEAARDGALFGWLPEDLAASRGDLRRWLEWSLEASRSGREVPYTIFAAQSGNTVGSTWTPSAAQVFYSSPRSVVGGTRRNG